MTRRRIATLLCLLGLVWPPVWSQSEPDAARRDQGQEPLDVDLVERTQRRLVQLDVSVRPKKKSAGEIVPQLTVDDFELVVAGNRIELRYADRICRPLAGDPVGVASDASPVPTREAPDSTDSPAPRGAPESPGRPPAPALRGTYLFYLEHQHLTMRGQDTALTMAEDLIQQLVTGGNRGMVVSSGSKLLQSELTEDPRQLLAFLRDVRKNTEQWTKAEYAELETTRLVEILRAQNDSPERARGLARLYQREESLATNRQLRRFAATIGSLADLDPPKAVLYFADIIRQRPGEHYLSLFGGANPEDPMLAKMGLDSFFASSGFDKVTEEAGAHGVRLYTVQAQGLQTGALGVQAGGRTNLAPNAIPSRRINEAEETLASFALETGGATFRGGTDKSTLGKIVDRIQTDLSCFYVLSFNPDNLAEDEKLPVRVRFNQDSPKYDELARQYELGTRGQLVVQSESKRKESILLAAHAASSAVESEGGRGVIIPLGFADGRYHALVQLMVETPGLPDGLTQSVSWDMGITHSYRNDVQHQISSRVEVPDPGTPVVLEASWTFKTGTNEIVSVAYENRFGQLASVNMNRDWPDPDHETAMITPVAVVQPREGVFVRKAPDGEDQRRSGGPVGIGDGMARVDRPMYMIALVCRSKRAKQDLWIERKLVGNVSVDFGLQQWSYAPQERCVQTRDLIRDGQVGWGDFTYRIRVYGDESLSGEALAEQSRPFTAVDPEAAHEAQNRDQPGASVKIDPLARPQ